MSTVYSPSAVTGNVFIYILTPLRRDPFPGLEGLSSTLLMTLSSSLWVLNSMIDEIVTAMGSDPQNPNTAPIALDNVKSWMVSDDIEVLGAIFHLLTDTRHYTRINPPLKLEEYHPFTMRYFERCFREDPDGKWSDSRYSAAWGVVNLFLGLWSDPKVPRSAIVDLKAWLAKLYREGDHGLRACLVAVTLGHLFEKRSIAEYFSDWQAATALRVAYKQALAVAAKSSGLKP